MSVQGLVKTVFVGLFALLGGASVGHANICDVAAHKASDKTGVPVDILLSITRLETGRGRSADPWPWAVNQAGDGTWFDSEDDARSFVFSKIKRGVTNIDIGCFQINYRWHSDAFRSLDDMFDPVLNATYAGEFLNQLYAEFGNWTDAAGAFHSRTPQYAERYKDRFQAIQTKVASLDTQSLKQSVVSSSSFIQLGPNRVSSPLLAQTNGTPFIDFNRSR